MEILIINSAERGINEFTTPIKEIIEKDNTTVKTIEYQDIFTEELKKYDGAIISGSPQGDDIVEHHQPWFEWVKTYNKPVLGICAGHHIIGFMHGAAYLRSAEPESGIVPVQIVKQDAIFKDIPEVFDAMQMHNDSITLPSGFIHLAKSAVCFNQGMKHAGKPVYTFQFHPEFINHGIIRNFIGLCIKR